MTCETIHYKNHTESYPLKDQGQTNYNFILLENFERDSVDILP